MSTGPRISLAEALDIAANTLAIRTGSADWSYKRLATGWKRASFHSKGGLLRREDGSVIPCCTERELFNTIGLPWVEPVDREVE